MCLSVRLSPLDPQSSWPRKKTKMMTSTHLAGVVTKRLVGERLGLDIDRDGRPLMRRR